LSEQAVRRYGVLLRVNSGRPVVIGSVPGITKHGAEATAISILNLSPQSTAMCIVSYYNLNQAEKKVADTNWLEVSEVVPVVM
jgi:hypothetical protein